MSILGDFESLDEEVKDLLQNYKLKKTSAYEPCTSKNFKECLIGLHEELSLFNIHYIFNPHTDIENDTITTEALVNLINSNWTLVQYHKNATEKANRLLEENKILECTNKQLSGMVKGLKDKLGSERNESRACVASAQRISTQSHEVYQKLQETRAKLIQITKQKETNEKCLQNKIVRLQLENDKLMDRLRNKSDKFIPCAEVCDSTIMQLKDRERKQRLIISQLQASNQELLREILVMKEDIVLAGLDDIEERK